MAYASVYYRAWMDSLAGLLDGPRARGAFLLRSVMVPPWSIRIQDEAPLTLLAVARGHAWVVPDSGEPVRLDPGDVAVVRGDDPYTVADDPATAPAIVIHPGQRCTTVSGESLAEPMSLGVRTWGNDPVGSTTMLTGTYQMSGEVSTSLLAALPDVLVLRADEWDCPLLPLLAAEVVKDEPGQEAVLDRMLDLVLIAVLRTWFARTESTRPSVFAAYADPMVGRALRLLQNNPAHAWTVAELAGAVGASRAALARRFSVLVGESPMAFLTGWRLALAADLLREPRTTIAAVARQVGYGSPFALSTAFKRSRGMSPQEYRRRPAPEATVA
jgi:AraC-like DNA-binding protein